MIGGNIANFALTLGRNKLLALFFGPEGLGWIALVNNIIETVSVAAGMGVCDAYNRELPRARPRFTQTQLISSGLGLFVISLVLVLPPAIWLLLETVDPRDGWTALIIGFAISAVLAAAWRVFGGIYLGFGFSRRLVTAMVLGGIANLVVAAILLWLGVRDLMVYVAMSPGFLAVLGAWGLWPQLSTLVSWPDLRRMPAWRPILAIAGPVVLGLLLEPAALLYLRAATETRFGELGLGLIQPGLLFVIMASSMFNAFMGITIARWDQLHEPAFSRRYMVLLACSVALPVAGSAFMFLVAPIWPFVVELLFTAEFVPGTQTISYFLAGEALRMGGSLLMHTLFSRKLGYLTILPRAALLGVAIAGVQAVEIASIMDIARIYTAAFGAFFAVSLVLWLGAQLRFRQTERAA